MSPFESMLERYRDVPVILEEYNETVISDEKFAKLMEKHQLKMESPSDISANEKSSS